MDNINTNQNVPVFKKLLTNWFLLPSISLIILGIFRFKDFGLFFWFLCGDAPCQPLQIFGGFLSILFWIVSCLTPGLLLVMIFRSLYRLPLLILGIGALPLPLTWFSLFLRGELTIENMLQLTQRGFAYWVSSGTAQAILFVIYVFAFLIFRLLSSPENAAIDRLKRWTLTTISVLTGIWIVVGVVAPQAFVVTERKVALKTEGLQSGTLYYSKNSNQSTIYRLKPNNQRESIDISPCKMPSVPSIMISWDQKFALCRMDSYDDSSKKATLVLINLTTGQRQTLDILPNEPSGYPLSQYSWSVDGRDLLFSSYAARAVENTLYSLNTQDMQFSEIYKLDNPSHKVDGAIYSPNKNKIALLSQDEQQNDHLFIMDADGNNVKSVPLIGVDCTKIASCTIYFLQFSKSSSKVFYGVSQFSNTYNYIFNLYDIETGVNEQIRLSQRYSLESRDSLLFYDGDRSIMYLDDSFGKNPGLLRHTFGELQAKPMNISYGPVRSSTTAKLSSDGEWLFYRDIEGSNTWSTWTIRASDGQRFRIMNEAEFILVNDEVQPIFVYWFP